MPVLWPGARIHSFHHTLQICLNRVTAILFRGSAHATYIAAVLSAVRTRASCREVGIVNCTALVALLEVVERCPDEELDTEARVIGRP
jgi:hypothetical protein